MRQGPWASCLNVLSETGHYTHNSVLIHDNSDYETYDILQDGCMCMVRTPVKYYQRHLRTFTANSKLALCNREIDFMMRKNIF